MDILSSTKTTSGINAKMKMIMKKILLSLLAIATVFVSCKKEASVEPESSKIITIAASCDDVTKTTYTDAGVFSWSSGDRISYIVKSSSTNKFNLYTYNTSSTGANASFSGSAPSGEWTAYNYAYYPNYDVGHSQASNQMSVPASTTLQATLAGTITAAEDRLSGIIPMIGVKTGTDASGTVDHYHFYPVTGVLKVSFTGLPATARQIRLTVPDAAIYPLNGTFNIDTERAIPEIKATDVATGYELKYLNFDYSGADDAFYFPIPTGTIPAGKLTVSVTDGTNTLYAVTNKQDITLVRGEITELPVITVQSVMVKIGGTALAPKATFYFSGDVTSVKWNAGMSSVTTSGTAKADITTSGTTVDLNSGYSFQFYFAYRAYIGDTPVGESDTQVRYWALSADDNNKICKQFTSVLGTVEGLSVTPAITHTAPFASNESPTLTFAPSDNPVKGNVMMTEFCGVDGKAYGNYVQLVNSGGWVAPSAPTITMNTPDTKSPFCYVADTPYYLFRDNMGGGPVFRVKTTKYPSASWDESVLTAYGKVMDFVCWNAKLGLTSSLNSWTGCPLYVEYYVVPK